MKPVVWGILSTARIGTVQVIPGMQKSKLVDIRGIASRSLDKAEAAARELGIPRAYGSYEELLADPEIEAVYNPLPNHLHVPLTLKALAAGKHVLCEKPIAMNAAEARQLVDARDRTGLIVEEAFMVRHARQWKRVCELVVSGAIGELRTIQGFFSYYMDDPANIRSVLEWGGGGVLDIGCYPIVTSRMVTGLEPSRIVAAVRRHADLKVDWLASAIMEFPNGVIASWTCSTQVADYQRMHFVGTKGRIEVEIPFNAPKTVPCRLLIDDGSDLHGGGIRVEEVPVCDHYTAQGEDFSRAVRGEMAPVVSLESSVANMRVLDAVFESERKGGWVKL